MAADSSWLRMAQRPPSSFSHHADDAPPCRQVRSRLLERLPKAVSSKEQLLEPEEPEEALLTPEFDMTQGVHDDMGLYDLMRQREDSEHPGLRRYSDKVLFKSRLMTETIPVPEIYFMSNDVADVLAVLRGLPSQRFVAKPTHLAATSFVYVMKDGTNLVNGLETSLEEVAAGLQRSFEDRHLDDWATESTPPGIIIEELVEAPNRGGLPGSTPDELKCQTFFGKMLFC